MVLRRAALIVGLLLAPGAVEAQAAQALLDHHARLERELARPASPARERRLVTLLDGAIDYDAIVRRVLVVHWGELSEDARREVTDLLTRAIRHRYRASVEALTGWRVEVVSDTPQGIGRRVETRATRADETRSIGYDLFAAEGAGFRIVDLRFDGSSLVHQYRVQFDAVIRRHGWDGFLARLRRRVEVEET